MVMTRNSITSETHMLFRIPEIFDDFVIQKGVLFKTLINYISLKNF